MEVTIPSWLNKEFVETALRSAGDRSMKVVLRDVRNATAAGDNYSSDMYRVTVEVTRGDRAEVTPLIVKAAKETAFLDELVRDGGFFDREIKVFTNTLPSIHRLLCDASPGKYQPFSANFFYTISCLPTSVLVLEDLKAQGFKMAERTAGLDLNHCLLVMRQIGRFHAATVVLHEKEPDQFRYFQENVFSSAQMESSERIFNTTARSVAEEVGSWPQYTDKFGDKLLKLSDNAYLSYNDSVKRDDEEFNVLCHGDLWLNNMMFRYSDETGEVTDVRFVDYQASHWTSPAIDLLYFLYSSVSLDLLDKQDVLLEEYHKSRTQAFSHLGYRGFQPSLNQLKQQLQKRGYFAVLISCTLLPIFLVDRSSAPDVSKLVNKKDMVYLSDVYKGVIKKLLPIFEENGWL